MKIWPRKRPLLSACYKKVEFRVKLITQKKKNNEIGFNRYTKSVSRRNSRFLHREFFSPTIVALGPGEIPLNKMFTDVFFLTKCG